MANDSEIWIAKCVAAKLDRLRHGNHVTQEQLRKSIQQITFSAELLKLPVPDVWHPQLPDQDRSMRALLRDRPARRGSATRHSELSARIPSSPRSHDRLRQRGQQQHGTDAKQDGILEQEFPGQIPGHRIDRPAPLHHARCLGEE
ncbi:MAG: hypothetical protein KGJ00_07505 [Bradyrhizobium sp.]|nr:hypothetical protein [Bradyrhizobium sp.]